MSEAQETTSEFVPSDNPTASIESSDNHAPNSPAQSEVSAEQTVNPPVQTDAVAPESSPPAEEIDKETIEANVIEALKTVYDPEIPVNIYELGLIYKIEISDSADVDIKMTLTAPGCPVAGTLPLEVEQKAREVQGVRSAAVQLVWDPPWDMTKMTEAARLQLNLF